MGAIPLTAGARVRIVIEATVESLDSGSLALTGGIGIDRPDLLDITVLEPGWQPGDIADDGHGRLLRVRRDDGVDHWVRQTGGRAVYDDETNLASLAVVQRAEPGGAS